MDRNAKLEAMAMFDALDLLGLVEFPTGTIIVPYGSWDHRNPYSLVWHLYNIGALNTSLDCDDAYDRHRIKNSMINGAEGISDMSYDLTRMYGDIDSLPPRDEMIAYINSVISEHIGNLE